MSDTRLSIEQFDCRSQSRIQQRTQELVASHEQWIASQPEVREIMADFMQALLMHKPDDALAFMKEYFNDIRATHQP